MMVMHEISLSQENTSQPISHEFHLDPADRVALGRFGMTADELVEALKDPNVNLARPDNPTLSRPDLQPVIQAVLTAALVGAGMRREDAKVKTFNLMHNGAGLQRSREIVLKLLDGDNARDI